MKVLEPQELEKLKELNKTFADKKNRLADFEIAMRNLNKQKEIIFSELDAVSAEFANVERELTEKYGEVTVNIETGEIK